MRRRAGTLSLALTRAVAAVTVMLALDGSAQAAEASLDGAALGPIWAIPFIGILLSIALGPLLTPGLWHHHYGKIAAGWGIATVLALLAHAGVAVSTEILLHTLILEYIPFILLLLALYTVTGGMRMEGPFTGLPGSNTVLLGAGAGLASLTGTTGAAMLLIRPVLKANEWRRYKVHVVVFFIFLVANIGGSLTPLGDPPLFLGFLKGVDFFWPTIHLAGPMFLVSGILLVVFFGLDSWFYRKEQVRQAPVKTDEPLGIEGSVNILLLAGVVGAVLLSGIWKPGIGFEIYHVHVDVQNVARDLLLLGITVLSLMLTSKQSRRLNGFNWFPIIEVAKLFAGIFLTIIPAIAILRAGTNGALGAVVAAVNQDGQPVNSMYFWATGLLSSFLDNAPTYLVFFNTAGGEAAVLMHDMPNTLLAISAGAVFMGANTYIGNAPNFMVKSIAEERGVAMPSFFAYMIWSGLFLIPMFVLTTLVFFR
jgi:Na+/H+ antiporter NhaD/arsenite permease-like protein